MQEPRDYEGVPAMPEFEDWVSARAHVLMRFAFLVTGNAADADDALQEALISAYQRWDVVAGAVDPDAYVRRMIVNAHTSWWRRFRRRETPVDVAWSPALAGVDAPAEDVQRMWGLCGELPARQRVAIVLRYYEGMQYGEIAEILDCSEGTVRSQVHRALATLRRRLDGEDAADA